MSSTTSDPPAADTGEYHRVDPGWTRRAAFDRAEYGRRVEATHRAMAERGIDVLLVHAPENLCYLTGYETSGYFEYQVAVVARGEAPQLLIRNVERRNVDEYAWLDGAHLWRDGTDPLDATAALVARVGAGGTVAIESHSWFVPADLAAALTRRLPNHVVVASDRLVERLRLVKSPAELELVRRAAGYADVAMAAAVEAAVPGATEAEIAAAAYAAQIRAGSEYPALPHYVSSGERLEVGHAHWTNRPVPDGGLLKMEYLGVSRRYHAGLTRAVAVGSAYPDDVVDDLELCIALQDATLADVRPGTPVDDLTRRARQRLVDAGRAPFRIRLGYSMGIGFPPIAGEGQTADFRDGATWELVPGMVFHMLSVLRVGLVVSDTVVTTDSGCERLTHTPRHLIGGS